MSTKMIDLHDVSVIAPATIDSADRLRNVDLLIKYFETFCVNYEIIIAEQDSNSKLSELTRGRAGVFLRHVKSENSHSRARTLNSAAVLSERKYVLIYDVDDFIPPAALKKALAMARSGVDFVLPYNGVAVQVKKAAIDKEMDLHALMSKVPFFSRLHELRPPKFDSENFEHMYGSALSDTVGGIMLCNRRQFFLAGAMNNNMLSVGCEDTELYHRIRKLGFKVERLDDSNIFHYEHVRFADSLRNNFFQSSLGELELVKAMDAGELRRYVNDGYKKIELDTAYDLTVTNTVDEFSVKISQSHRVALPNTAIILAFENSAKEDVREIDKFFDYMETNFDNYYIFVIEGEFTRFRMFVARKFTEHICHRTPLLSSLSDDEIKKLIYTNRPTIELFRFEHRFDSSRVTDRYSPTFQAAEPN